MLRRLEEIIGCKVSGSDGELGTVKDALFDEEKWAVRHMVVDSGTWLSGNQVLISPFSVRSVDLDQRTVDIDLSRKEIEDAPSIESDRPVSRQYESSYYDHYGWPPYWIGPMTWGIGGYPAITTDATLPLSTAEREMEEMRREQQDPHLHSFNEVNGYKVEASDGSLGDIEDLIIDAESWKVRYFVIDTSKFLPSKDVLVPPEDVDGILFHNSSVKVGMTKEQLRDQPEFKSIDAIGDGASTGPVTLSREGSGSRRA